MTDIIQIKVEKSQLALKLEQELRLNFTIKQHYPFDNLYDLSACIETSIEVPPLTKINIPTGIYLQINNPYYESIVVTKNDLANKGIIVLNNYMNFGYRNQIYIILYNTNKDTFIINPGDFIASLKFNKIPQVHFEYTEAIEESTIPSIGNTWVQKAKNINEARKRTGIEPDRQTIVELVNNKGGDVEEIS